MSETTNSHLKLKQMKLLSEQLERFRTDKLFTDVTLIDGDGASHLTHKNVLAASSNYFKEKFNADPNIREIPFPNTSTRIIEALLKFSYNGTIDIKETDTKYIEELNIASRDFQFPLVDVYCSQFILNSLPVKDFLLRWQYAEGSNKEEIKTKVAAMIAEDFVEVENTPNFLLLPIECLQMVLAQDELKKHNYDLVFQAILKWVNHDIEGRAINVKSFVKDINWQDLSTELLDKLMEEEDDKLMDECPFLMTRIYKEAKQRFENSKQKQNAPAPDLTQNSPKPETTAVASINNSNNNNNNINNDLKINVPFESVIKNEGIKPRDLNPTLNITTTTQNANNRSHDGINELDCYKGVLELINQRSQYKGDRNAPTSRLYDRGDRNAPTSRLHDTGDRNAANRCETIPYSEITIADKDFVKDLTEELVMIKLYEDKSVIEVRKLNENKIKKIIEVNDIELPFSAAVCHDKEKIYIVGGRSLFWEVLPSFYSFDVKTEKWEILTDLTLERWAAGATVINGAVYAIGGIAVENKRLNKVECYSLITREWKEIEDMKLCREKPAVCSHNSRIYVVGGYAVVEENWLKAIPAETTASCEVYDLMTSQWTVAETIMPIGRNINEKIFVIGVMEGKICAVRAFCNGEFVMFVYNPDSCKWIGLPVSFVKAPTWMYVGVLKNRVLCFVDDAGSVYLNKCNNLKKFQMESVNRPKACYSAVFD